MNAHYKKLWLEALRSGKYKQGFRLLRNSRNQFCCLGVLCDIVDSSKWKLNELSADCYTYDNRNSYLPESILDLTGLKFDDGAYSANPENSLVNLNDTGQTFKEIAKVIEENF